MQIASQKKKRWKKSNEHNNVHRCFDPNSFHSGNLMACMRWEVPKLLAKYKNPSCNKSTEGPFFLPSNIPSSPGGEKDKEKKPKRPNTKTKHVAYDETQMHNEIKRCSLHSSREKWHWRKRRMQFQPQTVMWSFQTKSHAAAKK